MGKMVGRIPHGHWYVSVMVDRISERDAERAAMHGRAKRRPTSLGASLSGATLSAADARAAPVAASSVFEEWVAAHLDTRADARALVVSSMSLAPRRFDATGTVTTLCRQPTGRETASTGVDPQFADATFDAIYLHRMLAIGVPSRWLERACRILKWTGTVFVAAHPADFSFAPLPAGGDAHLLGRLLKEGGFGRIELVSRAPRLIIVAGRRRSGDSAR